MTDRLRHFLRSRSRAMFALACVLAVAAQLAFPVLHHAHVGHGVRLAATNHDHAVPVLQGEAVPHGTHADDDAAGCPECRMLSGLAGPLLRTSAALAPETQARRHHDSQQWFTRRGHRAHEGPPRAPPLLA